MADYFAVKHLAGSDLGWFRALYHRFANTNLKGINLNADPVIEAFYPDLPVIAAATGDRHPVGVVMHGPAAAPAYEGTFKLIRSQRSRNWRLNGTLVDDPIDEPGRFNDMRPGDIAIVAFDGRPAPASVVLVLLSHNTPQDEALWRYLRAAFPPRDRRTMFPLAVADIFDALAQPDVPEDHPMRLLVTEPEDEEALEDAGMGGSAATRRRRRGHGRRVSRREADAKRREAERTGFEGEALVDAYLGGRADVEHEWVARDDAYAPYDFRITSNGDSLELVDVKTTKHSFERPFHLSLGEVEEAVGSRTPYLIYRVYELDEGGAFLKVSRDIRDLARRLLAAHDGAMFGSIAADGFEVPVDAPGLEWSDPIFLALAEDEELEEL